ncbi:flagellar motor protein MotD [Chitinimonas lacunae]|uniref:Flagellar motor protein MotD n=1 Tax=Chitinimonas lacunae TaxID=1963018 RepID=A0ABV8MQ31_9NEIS
MARKTKHEEHENHERWLVSYADFITLLFAFFVVMYAISQVNEGKYRVLSDSLVLAFNKQQPTSPTLIQPNTPPTGSAQPKLIDLPFRNNRAAQERQQQAEKMKDMARDLQKTLASLIEEGQVRVTESRRGIAIEINASLLFPTGSATLDAKSSETLLTIARKLAAAENLIQIEGHTDNQPIRSVQFPSNWELSAARAGTVVRLFESAGVGARRLVAIGYADNRPLDGNDSSEGRARNRRVAIQILSDAKEEVATLPIPEADGQ